MSDLIKREDAMGAVQDHFNANGFRGYDDGQKMMDRIKALPSAETHEIRTETHGVCSDLISRADVIRELVRSSVYAWSVEQDQSAHNWAIGIINSLPTAEAVGVVRCKDCKFEFMCKQTVEQANADDVEHRPLEWCSYGERESTNE